MMVRPFVASRRSHILLSMVSAVLAALLPAAAQAQFSLNLSGLSNNTTQSTVSDFINGSAATANGVSITGAGGSSGATFGATLTGTARYTGGTAADNGAGTTSSSTATLNANYNFNFSVTAPNTAVYQVTVGTRITGGLTAIDDVPIFDGSGGTSSLSATTGFLNSVSNGSLALAGGSRGGSSGSADTNVNNTNSLLMSAVQGNGAAASNNLRFTFQLFASSPGNFAAGGDEHAVRLGQGNFFSPTFGASVDDYPGVGSRNQANDGHFVTVTAQVVNTKPIAAAGGPYTYSAGGLTQTYNGGGSVTGQAGNEGGQALSFVWKNASNVTIGSTVNPAVNLANSGLTTTLSTSTVNVTVTDNGPLNMVSNAANATVQYSNAASTSASAGNYSFNSSLANITAAGTAADADLAANAQVANFEQIAFNWKSGGVDIGNTPNSTAAPASSPASTTNAITFSQAVARGLTTTTTSIPLTVNAKDRFAVANSGAGVSNTGSISYTNSAVSGASTTGGYSFNSSLANVNASGSANDADLAANAVQANFEQVTLNWTSGGFAIGNTPTTVTAPTGSPATAGNSITLAQAVARGLITTTSSIPLTVTASDRSGTNSSSNTTISYTNTPVSGASTGGSYSFDANMAPVVANGSTNDADLAANAVQANFEEVTFSWTSGANPIGNTPTSTVAPTSSPAATTNTITFAQAVAAGLTMTTSSIPLGVSASDRANTSSSGSGTLSYANTTPVAGLATSTINPNYSNSFFDVFVDLDLAANGVQSGFEDIMYELSTSNTFGSGFLSGASTPTQTGPSTLAGTLTLTQLLSVFGSLGTFTAYANVVDKAGATHSLPFEVRVVPEPASILVWGGLAALVGIARWRRRKLAPAR